MHRARFTDPPLTQNQRAYLHEFDVFLRSRDRTERAGARVLMRLFLGEMCADAGMTLERDDEMDGNTKRGAGSSLISTER